MLIEIMNFMAGKCLSCLEILGFPVSMSMFVLLKTEYRGFANFFTMNINTRIFSLIALLATLSATGWAQTQQKATTLKKQETMITEKNNASDEQQIRQLIDGFVEAFRTKNVDLMMSLYAPGFVAFDIVPPLQNVGKDTYKKTWENAFTFFQDPIEFETRDLSITAGNDVAFSRQLLRLKATMVNGQKVDRWERLTFCFQKIDGKWLIVHEHVSVPADLSTGKAILDLKPHQLDL